MCRHDVPAHKVVVRLTRLVDALTYLLYTLPLYTGHSSCGERYDTLRSYVVKIHMIEANCGLDVLGLGDVVDVCVFGCV